MSEQVNLFSPQMILFHEIETLFCEDPEVHIKYDEDNCEIKLFVQGDKTKPLDKLVAYVLYRPRLPI